MEYDDYYASLIDSVKDTKVTTDEYLLAFFDRLFANNGNAYCDYVTAITGQKR